MDEQATLAQRFESNRGHLRAVAYRMLGSQSEADDAVQDAWLRLSRADTSAVDNLRAWLTTVVARVCLDMLRARESRREDFLDAHLSEVSERRPDSSDAECEELLADTMGPALIVVLETLTPAERLAFVLHDMFAVPFDEIASILGRSPTATRQLASRARRRVRGADATPAANRQRERAVVEAFLAASREGKFDALLSLLHPDVVLRADHAAALSGAPAEVRGSSAVAEFFKGRARAAKLAWVNGVPAAVWAPGGTPRVLFEFAIERGRIVRLDLVADPERLTQLEIAIAQ